MAELVDGSGALAHRVAEVRGHLAAAGGQRPEQVEIRVAASVAQLGLVARLVSPALALAAVDGTVLGTDLARLHWQPLLGGAFPLSLPDTALVAGRSPVRQPAGELAGGLAAGLLDGPVRALVTATEAFGVSPHILWGNVASAVNGAAVALTASAPAAVSGRAREIAELLLRQPLLRGSCGPDQGSGRFRRRSCCLIYRAAPGRAGGLCGDCVLTERPPGRAVTRSAARPVA